MTRHIKETTDLGNNCFETEQIIVTYTSGTYTPTVTAVANNSTPTVSGGKYIRIDSIVHVTVLLNVRPSEASILTQCRITLPVASSLASAADLIGCVTNGVEASYCGDITGDTENREAQVNFIALSTASRGFSCSFQYEIK